MESEWTGFISLALGARKVSVSVIAAAMNAERLDA